MKLCFALALVFTVFSALSEEITSSEFKERKNDIELKVEIPRKAIAGTEIKIRLLMTNKGKEVVTYGESTELRGFDIKLVDNDYSPVSTTKYWDAIGGNSANSRYVIRELAPGATKIVDFNISRVFDVTVAGDYFLTVSRMFNVLTKNKFSIEVSKAKVVINEPSMESK